MPVHSSLQLISGAVRCADSARPVPTSRDGAPVSVGAILALGRALKRR